MLYEDNMVRTYENKILNASKNDVAMRKHERFQNKQRDLWILQTKWQLRIYFTKK